MKKLRNLFLATILGLSFVVFNMSHGFAADNCYPVSQIEKSTKVTRAFTDSSVGTLVNSIKYTVYNIYYSDSDSNTKEAIVTNYKNADKTISFNCSDCRDDEAITLQNVRAINYILNDHVIIDDELFSNCNGAKSSIVRNGHPFIEVLFCQSSTGQSYFEFQPH